MKLRLNEKTVAELRPPADRPQAVVWDTELTGFGVVVGQRSRTLVVEARVGGRKRRTAIARHREPNKDGQLWNVQMARQRARELLGAMAAGIDPGRERRAERRTRGVTLRQGLELHVADMRKRGCSPRSIETIEAEIPKYCAPWLDRPLVDLAALDLHRLHDQLTGAGKRYLANRVIAELSAVWNSVDRLHELPTRNPASRVRRNKIPPKRQRVADEDLPGWYATVQTLAPIRRDLQIFVLFSALRSADARSIRWEHIDWQRGALLRPKPKGGESKAFELPLSGTCLDILRERQRDNAIEFKDHGGDHGWLFPGLSRAKPFRVQPVAESKERRKIEETGPRETILPGLHDLRRTYASVASDIGIPEIDRHVLMNHSFADKRVHDGYIRQSWERLVEAQAAIEAALWARLKPKKAKRKATAKKANGARRGR